jgi:hypothetical protein
MKEELISGDLLDIAAYQFVDVKEDDHLSSDDGQTLDELGRRRVAEVRRLLQLIGRYVDHIGDPVHHRTEFAGSVRALDRQHHDYRERGELGGRQAEANAQIDDGDDRAAQIQHPEDVRRQLRNPGDRRPAADFLDSEDVDSILFRTQ